ncbi:hypothetical protein BRC80_06545 [Halobacteriales archaeon QH_9_66_26]|nr:MAG: hypothetical protein BRC80_06545 [Halobacteriales archaeon QH_9_66_26]
METHRKGDLTEAVLIAELMKRSIPVSVPFGDNERYDIVTETPGGGLLKLQVKTGWMTDGTIEFHGTSQHTNATGNVYEEYSGDVDFFLVYCHELESMYLVRENEFQTRTSLRVEEPEQVKPSINWAEEYEFDATWPPA